MHPWHIYFYICFTKIYDNTCKTVFSLSPGILLSRHKVSVRSDLVRRPTIMTGREFLHKMKEKACFALTAPYSPDAGKVMGTTSRHITYGSHMVEGKSNHAMEDFFVSEIKKVDQNELGLFAIFDGHMGHDVAKFLQSHLFDNILKEQDFWKDPESAIKRAYQTTDAHILEQSSVLGKGGSTAVTAILINGEKLVVANVGDSRAVICSKGVARQLSVDHEPSKEKKTIESKGGFVSNLPGDVPRVDGQLAVARAFGDKSLKRHMSSEPHVKTEMIDNDVEFIILASDGLWKVMSNEEAVDAIKHINDARSAAKHLINEALSRKSKDDISCIVIKFQ
ncbi:Phosphoprotein phosphatase [Bertholletia excelsa]